MDTPKGHIFSPPRPPKRAEATAFSPSRHEKETSNETPEHPRYRENKDNDDEEDNQGVPPASSDLTSPRVLKCRTRSAAAGEAQPPPKPLPPVVAKPPPLVVADVPLSTTKALLMSVIFPKIHHVYVPPPTPVVEEPSLSQDTAESDGTGSRGDGANEKKRKPDVVVTESGVGETKGGGKKKVGHVRTGSVGVGDKSVLIVNVDNTGDATKPKSIVDTLVDTLVDAGKGKKDQKSQKKKDVVTIVGTETVPSVDIDAEPAKPKEDTKTAAAAAEIVKSDEDIDEAETTDAPASKATDVSSIALRPDTDRRTSEQTDDNERDEDANSKAESQTKDANDNQTSDGKVADEGGNIDNNDDNEGENSKHEMVGYVEGDDERGEEKVQHVVTAEEMATVVRLPTVAEAAAAAAAQQGPDARQMAAEATKKIRTFFGIVSAEEDEKPTIHLTKAEAVDALKHENEMDDDLAPNTAIRVEALLRLTFKDLLAEGHLFNAPIYTDIKTTHDDDDEMWCELSVMIKGASIGLVLDRLERIGVGSSVGTLSIYKAELCRTAYDYGKPTDALSQRDAPKAPAPGGGAKDGADSKLNKSEQGTNKAAVPGGEAGEAQAKNIEAARAEWKNAASRLRVEQVKEQIVEQSALSLDFLALLFIASILAGIGLITDSTVVIVASMLVSPIMGPVMGMTFGARVNDWALAKSSSINEVVALLISVAIGGAIGFTSSFSSGAEDWPTNEMMSRGEPMGLVTGICIAIPSGMGVALSILGNNTASLVGVAISASLLPPAVNSGICWAHAILVRAGAVSYANTADFNFAQIGGISFLLTVVNIVCIWIAGMAMFAIKEVAPTKAKSAFWARDIKVARAQKQDSKKSVDVEVIRKGLSDALEKERQKEQKMKREEGGLPLASRRRKKKLIRKASGPRTEVTFNLQVNPVPIDDISQMDAQHAKAIGLEPLVEPFPVPKSPKAERKEIVAPSDRPGTSFGPYAYGVDERSERKKPMMVDDVQYVGLEDMAALLGFDDEDHDEESITDDNNGQNNLWSGLAGWFNASIRQ